MPRADSHRFGQIRGKLPQVSPKRSTGRLRPAESDRNHAYWGQDQAVEGGPDGLRQRGIPARYYFEKQWRGQRYKAPLGRSLPQARMRVQQWLNAMERGDFSRTMLGTERTGIGEFLDEALSALKVRGNLGRKSIASYRGRIDHFLRYLHEEHPSLTRLSEATHGVCMGFVEWRRRQKVSRSGKAVNPETRRNHPAPQTVKDDVRRLRALFKVAVDRHLLKTNPWGEIRVPVKAKDRPSPARPLAEDEVRRVLAAATKYDKSPNGPGAQSTFRGMFRDMLQFYVLTGLRKEELIYLSWEMVELGWGRHGRIAVVGDAGAQPSNAP